MYRGLLTAGALLGVASPAVSQTSFGTRQAIEETDGAYCVETAD